MDKGFAHFQSEFYVQDYNKDRVMETDVEKSMNGTPDYVAFNVKANQCMEHPLQTSVGDKIRMWVINLALRMRQLFTLLAQYLIPYPWMEIPKISLRECRL